MKEQLISFETAKLVKEKGFNEICDSCYDIYGKEYNNMNHKNDLGQNVYSAPTQNLLQKWLRDTHKIDVLIMLNMNDEYSCHIFKWHKSINTDKNIWEGEGIIPQGTDYELVLEEGLQEGLKLI